jgi:hypothetical protein
MKIFKDDLGEYILTVHGKQYVGKLLYSEMTEEERKLPSLLFSNDELSNVEKEVLDRLIERAEEQAKVSHMPFEELKKFGVKRKRDRNKRHRRV